jgi:hypothetical protein
VALVPLTCASGRPELWKTWSYRYDVLVGLVGLDCILSYRVVVNVVVKEWKVETKFCSVGYSIESQEERFGLQQLHVVMLVGVA